MDVYTMPRGAGKTTQIIDWVLADPASRAAIVPTGVIALHVTASLVDYGVDLETANRSVYSVADIQAGRHRGRQVEFAVDELDWVLSAFVGGPVVMATRS